MVHQSPHHRGSDDAWVLGAPGGPSRNTASTPNGLSFFETEVVTTTNLFSHNAAGTGIVWSLGVVSVRRFSPLARHTIIVCFLIFIRSPPNEVLAALHLALATTPPLSTF
jgi:hypothetical protein